MNTKCDMVCTLQVSVWLTWGWWEFQESFPGSGVTAQESQGGCPPSSFIMSGPVEIVCGIWSMTEHSCKKKKKKKSGRWQRFISITLFDSACIALQFHMKVSKIENGLVLVTVVKWAEWLLGVKVGSRWETGYKRILVRRDKKWPWQKDIQFSEHD